MVLAFLLATTVAAAPAPEGANPIRLRGAGATFPNPLYQRWIQQYARFRPGVRVDYQSIGSGGGIKGLISRELDFAGIDAPLNPREREAAGDVLYIPTTALATVVAYNLPDLKGELRLTGPLIAAIYLGDVTRWNDERIREVNSHTDLPDLEITPTFRTDGSGTTFVFTNYLCTQSDEWKREVGAGKTVKWPVGQGGKGGEGPTAWIQQTPGALGYIELGYAANNRLPFVSVRNASGKFVRATPESATAATARAAEAMRPGAPADLWDKSGDDVYPICSFTYIVVPKDLACLKDRNKADALVAFLRWAVADDDAAASAKELYYAPLAAPVRRKAAAALDALTWDGQSIGSPYNRAAR